MRVHHGGRWERLDVRHGAVVTAGTPSKTARERGR